MAELTVNLHAIVTIVEWPGECHMLAQLGMYKYGERTDSGTRRLMIWVCFRYGTSSWVLSSL